MQGDIVHMKHLGTKTLETKRLFLRKCKVFDYKDSYKHCCSDHEYCELLGFGLHGNYETTRKSFTEKQEYYKLLDFYEWAIIEKQSNTFIGSIALIHYNKDSNEIEVGYGIGKPFYEKGYMSEALAAVLEFAFDEVGFDKVIAYTKQDNFKSINVLSKQGFKLIKVVINHKNELYTYDANYFNLNKEDYHILRRNRKLYDIFVDCFPIHEISERAFFKKLDIEQCYINTIEKEKEIVAYSIIRDNAILLLCVNDAYRKQGYGKQLLIEAEKYIEANGYDKIILGHSSNYLFQGIPIEENAQRFFEKNGYTASWTSVNMVLDLSEYNEDSVNIPEVNSIISFRYANENDKEVLLEAVEQVNNSWTLYYKYCTNPILLAIEDNRIVGFEILTLSEATFYTSKYNKVGSIGCVGVLKDYRDKGIGRQMVAYALKELKKAGSNMVFIGYTWLEDWYGRLGFKTVSRQWMGEKSVIAVQTKISGMQ